MSEALSKTLKGDSFDNIFKEVSHAESLNLRNPHALRLFHLDVVNYGFSQKELMKFLRKNIGRYVYSRAKLEQFKLDDIHCMEEGYSKAMKNLTTKEIPKAGTKRRTAVDRFLKKLEKETI